MVHAGFGTYIDPSRVVAVVAVESNPIRRMLRKAEEAGKVIDATYGRKQRTAVRLDNGDFVLSAVAPDTMAQRVEEARRAVGGGAG